jgi:hypothetical protein
MIFFVAPAEEIWTIAEYREQSGEDRARRLATLTYDDIARRGRLSLGTYIFGAIDRLTPTEREVATRCGDALDRVTPPLRVLNRPGDVLLRYELLRRCFERRRNAFRAYRPWELHRCRRFPVFVRPEREHLGSLSPFLRDRRQVVAALAVAVLRGFRLRDLLIVEYCDTADPAGVFRAYSAVAVGEQIVPKALIHNRKWVTKWDGRLIDEEKAREQLEYLEGDPHAAWLRETFSLARISFGRIDYGVKDCRPQVWEINTNPTLVRRTGAPSTMTAEQWRLLGPGQEGAVGRLGDAFDAIDTDADPSRTVPIEVSRAQIRRLAIESRQRQRLLARDTAIARVARVPIRVVRRLWAPWNGPGRAPDATR